MALRLITGRANTGKTGRVLDDALSVLRDGGSATLVVPTIPDVHRLEAELSGKCPLGVRVATLQGLAEDLWLLNGDGRRPIGEATRQAVVSRLVADEQAGAFGALARSPGLLRLLQRAAKASAPRAPAAAAPATGPMASMVRVVDRYRDELARLGLVERGWIFDLLADDPPAAAGFVGLARTDSLTAAQARFLMQLATRNHVTVAITWERDFAPTAANDVLADLLSASADRVEHCVGGACDAEVAQVAASLYSGPGSIRATGDVRVATVAGSEAEAAFVARLAAEYVSAGTAPERVAIVCGDLATRESALDNTLAAEGLRAQYDVTRPVSSTAFGRALGDLLDLALGVGGRAEALALLSSPFSDADHERVRETDRRWRRHRVADASRLCRDIVGLGGRVGEAVAFAVGVARRPVDPQTSGTWQKMADSLLETALAAGPAGLSEAVIADAAAHRAVMTAVREMASVPGAPFTGSDLRASLATLNSGGATQESEGFVQVVEAGRLGSRRFDAVVVAGMTAAEFPVAVRGSLGDEIAALVGEPDLGAPEDAARLRFYLLVARARHQVALVRQASDSDGASVRASVLWEELLDAYRSAETEECAGSGAGPAHEHVPPSAVEDFAPVFSAGRRAVRQDPAAAGLRLRVLDRGAPLHAPEVKRALSAIEVFSATEVETYLRCPYRWFYERVLRPEEIDTELDARELGTRSHRMLAAFYERFGQSGLGPRVTEPKLPECLALFDEAAADVESKALEPSGVAEVLAAARAREWARRAVADDAWLLPGFVPAAHEMVFGDAEPVRFADARFRGRVDRVDTGDAGAFVTDYKSSRDVFGADSFEKEGVIQAVLYSVAVSGVLDVPVVGSVYRSLRSRQLRGVWRSELFDGEGAGLCAADALDERGFAAVVERAEERVAQALGGMRAGRIPRAPISRKACAFCALSALCDEASR